MKPILITLIFSFITLLPAGAVKKFQPNPINVASVLVEKTDSAKVASMCEYYGFSFQGVEDGYTVMKRPNGNEIRFTFNENGTPQKYPTIVVKAKGTLKEIDDRLKGLNLEKEGNIYVSQRNKYAQYITQCCQGPNNTIIFRRVHNPWEIK